MKKNVFSTNAEKSAFETKNSIYAITPEIIVFNPKFKRFLIFVSLVMKGKQSLICLAIAMVV